MEERSPAMNKEAPPAKTVASSMTSSTLTRGDHSSDSILVLDSSRSMGDILDPKARTSKLDLAKSALISALSRAVEGECPDRVGIITVSTNVFAKPIIKEVMPMGELTTKSGSAAPVKKNVPIETIAGIKCQGGTALYSAISHCVKNLVANRISATRPQQIVILTDSKNNTSEQPMRVLAEAARNHIRISVIDLGNEKVKESLKMISDATGGDFSFVSNAFELQQSLFSKFTTDTLKDGAASEDRVYRSRILLPAILNSGSAKPVPIAPKRTRAETVEEINYSVEEIRKELETLNVSLRAGRMTQVQFTEKYCVLQFELQELRQSIREQRSKLNKEMSEYALAKENMPRESELNKETNERLVELDRQIQNLKESAAFASR